MSEQEVKQRKRRSLEEREAEAKAELERIAAMRASKYKKNCAEIVSCIRAIVEAQAAGVQVPADLIAVCKSSNAVFNKYAE